MDTGQYLRKDCSLCLAGRFSADPCCRRTWCCEVVKHAGDTCVCPLSAMGHAECGCNPRQGALEPRATEPREITRLGARTIRNHIQGDRLAWPSLHGRRMTTRHNVMQPFWHARVEAIQKLANQSLRVSAIGRKKILSRN